MIYDAFPKGIVHLLAIPLRAGVAAPTALRPEHLQELEHLHSVVAAVAAHLRSQFPGYQWQVGYHARPSLQPLHLHIMTTDLGSEAVKKRVHYLSFASRFFVPAERVLRMLRERATVEFEPDELNAAAGRGDLPCRWCRFAAPTLPGIKAHIARCPNRP